jgi:hypothetical protein
MGASNAIIVRKMKYSNNTCLTCDTLPSSLMDSIASPKVKITKGKRVGAHSLVRNTLGVEGCVGASGWDLLEFGY